MSQIDVAIIGAGPYGLASTLALRRAGFSVKVFGDPLLFWRSQTPKGMLLRSPYEGSSIGDWKGPLTLEAFDAGRVHPVSRPVTADEFIEYGLWFQQKAVSDLDRREIRSVERAGAGFRLVAQDGEEFEAARVVVAAGVGALAWRPPQFDSLNPSLVSHSLDHDDLGKFAGQRVTVVGRGQSALESAALLHEAGSEVDVLVRAPLVRWLHKRPWLHEQWPVKQMLYAPPDVGPAGVSHLVAHPRAFCALPRRVQDRLGPRVIRAAGANWLIPRLTDVPIRLNTEVRDACSMGERVRLVLNDGTESTVDHVLLATGYQVDLSRYSFLSPSVLAGINTVAGWPRLSRGFETSVPGLHIVGAPAAWSHGPLLRFVAGSGYASRTLVKGLQR
ncbi:FAD-dependent oxidoreductase [Bradyrhizobium sp. USDA 4486]